MRLPATNMCSYIHQTALFSGVRKHLSLNVKLGKVNVVMAIVNPDCVAWSSALPACVCVCTGREREGAI